jgi:hypothetical protein
MGTIMALGWGEGRHVSESTDDVFGANVFFFSTAKTFGKTV